MHVLSLVKEDEEKQCMYHENKWLNVSIVGGCVGTSTKGSKTCKWPDFKFEFARFVSLSQHESIHMYTLNALRCMLTLMDKLPNTKVNIGKSIKGIVYGFVHFSYILFVRFTAISHIPDHMYAAWVIHLWPAITIKQWIRSNVQVKVIFT